jgi:acetyl-CoA synthetase
VATARPRDDHAALHAGFRWHVPPDFSTADAICSRWARATPDAVAIVDHATDATMTYAELDAEAARAATVLRGLGVAKGDRVAVVMPQRAETAVAHVALQRLGAVAMPLSALFGPEAVAHRLVDSGAAVAIADGSGIANLLAARGSCPRLAHIVAVGDAEGSGTLDWSAALARAAPLAAGAEPAHGADDAMLLIYTSGTTGPPKGALVPHRAMIGTLPGFVASQNWFPQSDAVFWSPADWAWTGGLMDALLPTLYFGRTIVASRARFDADAAFELMQRRRVTHTFLFPTALKAMMKAVPEPRARFDVRLRAVMSAGEALGDSVDGWCRGALGLVPNEMFGQTEINYVVGNSAHRWPVRPGSMGRAYPGHRVAVIDDDGREVPRGTPGDVAVHRRDVHGAPDPIFFLGYWNQPEATRAKYTGDPEDSWCRTGDTATMDDGGYLWYQGRGDDVFKVAGYRIGPSEIENCLVRHPGVANCAVVPKPDAARGAVVKAYIVLSAGTEPGETLERELQALVRDNLAPYEYPKEFEYLPALPMTTTGKVQRRVLRLQEEERASRAW